MLLSDLAIRRAKPKEKAYTLNDGNGLSLLIEPNGSKGWRLRYRFAGKPKSENRRANLAILLRVLLANGTKSGSTGGHRHTPRK